MRKFLLILTLIGFYQAIGQEDDSLRIDITSPYKAIYTHLYYLQPDTYNDSIASIPFEPKRRGVRKATKAAVELKQILDGNGIYVYMDEVPRNANYYDSALNKRRYILTDKFPDIYLLRRSNGNWVFSDASIQAIHNIHEETFRFGSGALLDLLPRMGSSKFLGLYIYQYIAILILALVSAIVYRLFIFLSEKLLKKYLSRSGYDSSKEYLTLLARPISVFVIILFLTLFVPVLQLPGDISQYVVLILRVLLPLMGTIIVYRFVAVISSYFAKLASKTESTLDDQMVPLIRKTLKTFVVITGSLFILQNLNVPILPLLTGLSIGGLAFALAAQDTIKNFFGSLMIFIDKPFQIGDWITSGDVDGTVEEVGFRSSRIRTFRNSVMYIPNGKLADRTIDNHGLRQYRRFFTMIAVTYDTPPALIESFVDGLRKIVETHPATYKDNYHVYLNEMANSSLNIMFYIFFEAPDWGGELKARHDILLKILQLAESIGINFAFPTQTLHVENLPGQPSLSPQYMNKTEIEKEMAAFFKKN